MSAATARPRLNRSSRRLKNAGPPVPRAASRSARCVLMTAIMANGSAMGQAPWQHGADGSSGGPHLQRAQWVGVEHIGEPGGVARIRLADLLAGLVARGAEGAA